MTKTQMPEPTAEIRIVGNVTIFDLTPVGKQQGLSVGQKFITTGQAEAYANDRVREALEEAIIEVMRCKTSGIIRNDTVDKCADAIRALIQPTKNEAEE